MRCDAKDEASHARTLRYRSRWCVCVCRSFTNSVAAPCPQTRRTPAPGSNGVIWPDGLLAPPRCCCSCVSGGSSTGPPHTRERGGFMNKPFRVLHTCAHTHTPCNVARFPQHTCVSVCMSEILRRNWDGSAAACVSLGGACAVAR